MKSAYLALDQGTTSTRAIVFGVDGGTICSSSHELIQLFPKDGWVEHDLEEIWRACLSVVIKTIADAEQLGYRVDAMGITNQRETTCIWNVHSGAPVCNAIVWQDRRTSDFCKDLVEQGHEKWVSEQTGLRIDPYFSASKIRWILSNITGARQLADQGDLLFGTIETFLIWRFTGGKHHLTDATNAARTSLLNIKSGQWDEKLCDLFGVPKSILAEIRDCTDIDVDTTVLPGRQIRILSAIGDQQSAALGQACFLEGDTKSTYGTGCFVTVNTGAQFVRSSNRLLTTIALQIDGKRTYAVEGSIFIAGAAVQWLRDGMGLIADSAETAVRAEAAADSELYMVPAFTGLGAPWWVPDARGSVYGITRNTGPNDFVRAALDSVAYQTSDLFDALVRDGISLKTVRVDGGMAANNWFLQRLSDILDKKIERPSIIETTAFGACMLTALADGAIGGLEDIARTWKLDRSFTSLMDADVRRRLKMGWDRAVRKTIL